MRLVFFVCVLCLAVVPGVFAGATHVSAAPVYVEARVLGPVAPDALQLAASTPGYMQPAAFPEVRFREQGRFAPQSDLSVRGGSFNSAGIAIGGAALWNPQTEHWNLGTPLPAEWFGPPELLTGLDRFAASAGHPSGTLALRLARPQKSGGRFETTAGSRGLFGVSGNATHVDSWQGVVLATGAFAGYDRTDQTDGYDANDLERFRAGGRLGVYGGALELDLASTYEDRTFGAQGFYAGPANLESDETVRELLNLLNLRHTAADGDEAQLTLAWRRNWDAYRLDRHRGWWYRNATTTDDLTLHADTRRTLSDQWALILRLDADLQRIKGKYRGTLASVPLGHHLRRHVEAAVLPVFTWGGWEFTFGGSAGYYWNSDTASVWLPAAGAAYRVDGTHRLFANYTEALRRPSFTELNYESPTSLGNRGLKDQRSRTAEAGWEVSTPEACWRTTVFMDRTGDAVDWLYNPANGKWVAENLDRVTTWGLATGGQVAVDEALEVFGGAAWLYKRSADDVYASRYTLDYPTVDVRAGAQWRPLEKLACTAAFNAWRQIHNPARGGSQSAFVLDFAAEYRMARGTWLKAGVWNLLGDDFETYAGQPMAGRTVYASLRHDF